MAVAIDGFLSHIEMLDQDRFLSELRSKRGENMGVEKSYLKDQVYLLGLNSSDLFTEEEYAIYQRIAEAKNELNKLDKAKGEETEKRKWIDQKKQAVKELNDLTPKFKGVRSVRLGNILFQKDKKKPLPAGVTWENVKFPKKIAEFSSELTRAMGLKPLNYTFDQIVVNWKSMDVLEQIVKNGVNMPILQPDGSIKIKHYHFFSSSAGQLRRDKLVLLSDEIWEKIHERIECGLTWERINEMGGVNVN